jgi:DNA-directed RNA polymerase III subunit RPC3
MSHKFDLVCLKSIWSFVLLRKVLDPTTISNIASHISEDDDLTQGLMLPSPRKSSTTSLIKEYIAMLAASDNPTSEGQAGSFVSLSSSKVQVEFDIIARRLRRRVMEAVTRERYGDQGTRILGVLLDTGKMDEKQVRFS